MTLFSVITVTKNHLSGLKHTCASLKLQTCTDLEWIVIDGASADGTVDFLRAQTLPYLHWVSEIDGGIYEAMNKGIERAAGDYLLFLNAGDTLADAHVFEHIAELTKGQPDFIYGDSFEGSHYKRARGVSTILTGMFTHHQAMFYRRDALGLMRYHTPYRIAADYDLTLRFLTPEKNVTYFPTPVCIFEQGGISQRAATQGRKEQYRSRRKNGACSTCLNVAIYCAQSFLYLLRKYVPHIYWDLKKFTAHDP